MFFFLPHTTKVVLLFSDSAEQKFQPDLLQRAKQLEWALITVAFAESNEIEWKYPSSKKRHILVHVSGCGNTVQKHPMIHSLGQGYFEAQQVLAQQCASCQNSPVGGSRNENTY